MVFPHLQLPLTQKKHTSYQSHQIIIQSHILSPPGRQLFFGVLLFQYSPAINMFPQVVFVLFTYHQPASALLFVEHRGGSEAGVKTGQNQGGGSLAALSCEKFNLSFSFPPSRHTTLIPIFLNFVFSAVSSLLLVTLIQSRFSCLRVLSRPPHVLIPLCPVVDDSPITETTWKVMHFSKRCGWNPAQ